MKIYGQHNESIEPSKQRKSSMPYRNGYFEKDWRNIQNNLFPLFKKILYELTDKQNTVRHPSND
jgi:hypothetical protein